MSIDPTAAIPQFPAHSIEYEAPPIRNRKWLWRLITILLCCFLTNRATRWYFLHDAASQAGHGIYFDDYEKDLSDFVSTHSMKDGEKLLDSSIPYELRKHKIGIVYRKGRFLFFQLRPSWIDDASQEFVWQLDWEGGAVNELCRRDGTVYQIYTLRKPGWIFWMHN